MSFIYLKKHAIDEIEAQGWSLAPGRYVGTPVEGFDEEDFYEKFVSLHSELRKLNEEANQIERAIEENFLLLVNGK